MGSTSHFSVRDFSITRFDGLGPDAPPRAIRPRPRVLSNPFLRLGLFIVLYVALYAALITVGIVAGLDPMAPGRAVGVWINIVATVVAYVVLIRVIEARSSPVELQPARLAGLPVGIVIGAGLFGVCFVLILALGGFEIVGTTTPDWHAWWLMLLSAGLGAGVTEELLFRGVFYGFVEETLGTWVAVAASGGLFGVAHLMNPNATSVGALVIAVAGFLFALGYATTRNLWLLMGFHGAWNVIQGPILGIPVSGTDPNGFLQITARGSDLISGGAFGAEASLVTAVVLIALVVWLTLRVARRHQAVAPMWIRRARQRRALTAGDQPNAESLDRKQLRAMTGSS